MNNRKRTRVRSKIDELPENIRQKVDDMLTDTINTYTDIAVWLKLQGFEVSKSAIGRYAIRTGATIQKLKEAQQQTEALVKVIKNNPESDYTEAGMMMLMDGLVKRLATAEEEFDNMPLDKVGRLINELSKTKAYKERVRQDMQKRVDLAFSKLEGEILKMINADRELSGQLSEILRKAKEKMISDD